MTDSEQLLDIEQAARFLNVSETSLRRWTNAGRLACLRVGRRRERRFRREDLLSFMESQPAVGSAAEPRPAEDGRMIIDGVAVRLGTHLCGLYDSDEGRIRQAADFLAGGCRPGCAGFLVAKPEDRARTLAALERADPAARLDIEAGRLEVGEYAPGLEAQLTWWETRIPAAIAAGATSVRVVGDIQGFAEKVSLEENLAYEAAYDRRIARRFPVVTLCQYDVRRFSSPVVLECLKLHRDILEHVPELVLG